MCQQPECTLSKRVLGAAEGTELLSACEAFAARYMQPDVAFLSVEDIREREADAASAGVLAGWRYLSLLRACPFHTLLLKCSRFQPSTFCSLCGLFVPHVHLPYCICVVRGFADADDEGLYGYVEPREEESEVGWKQQEKSKEELEKVLSYCMHGFTLW